MTNFLKSFLVLTIAVLFGAEAYAQCTNCKPQGQRQPVSRWSVPNQCVAPQLNRDHMSFTDPNNKCSFYDCAARGARDQLGCAIGGNNYFWDYGRKYCNRFVNQTYSKLSRTAKKWMNETLVCLQNALKDGCARDNRCRNCGTMRRWAFDSHTPCYTGQDPFTRRRVAGRTSLCELSLVDQGFVGTTPDAKDLATSDSIRQVGEVAAICGKEMLQNPLGSGIVRAGLNPIGTVMDAGSRLIGWD